MHGGSVLSAHVLLVSIFSYPGCSAGGCAAWSSAIIRKIAGSIDTPILQFETFPPWIQVNWYAQGCMILVLRGKHIPGRYPEILGSITVSIPSCYTGNRDSIPRLGYVTVIIHPILLNWNFLYLRLSFFLCPKETYTLMCFFGSTRCL